MTFQPANLALPGQTAVTPPGLPVVTGKSGATRKMTSKPPPPRPMPNSTWAEECNGCNPSRQVIPVEEVAPNVASTTPSLQVHSGSCGWAEEKHESGHAIAIANLHQERSHHEVNYTATTTSSSVGEPPPDEQEVHDEQDISVVTAESDNFLIQQMVVV